MLLGTFTTLRCGELAGSRRDCLNLEAEMVRSSVGGVLIDGAPEVTGGPAGGHDPARDHRGPQGTCRPSPEMTGWVFVGPKGSRLRRSAFRRTWNKARAAIGEPDLHFHDLRHVGNTLAAANGASLKEATPRPGPR
ncbi:tyrosine-type recombinase/integrase [Herbidospora cretacea]|uniref:tyrosine-type recombinase/integrase n=1 Tax=Herbidospora cretacea TaxID=28444 RepID=UPI0012DF6167|nr:tyrosine-type recombinase/integrase [Herbidospora cretacea]